MTPKSGQGALNRNGQNMSFYRDGSHFLCTFLGCKYVIPLVYTPLFLGVKKRPFWGFHTFTLYHITPIKRSYYCRGLVSYTNYVFIARAFIIISHSQLGYHIPLYNFTNSSIFHLWFPFIKRHTLYSFNRAFEFPVSFKRYS